MAFGWLTNETKSLYIARPAEYAGYLIYLHPDKSIPRGTKLTVRSDECALFFREGRLIGRINAGTILLDTANIPFLGHLLVDKFTDANHFICEIFFVSLKETVFRVPLSSLGQFKDVNSANVVAVLGSLSYTVRVSSPEKLVVDLGGQNENSGAAIHGIFNGRMLNQFRKAIGSRALVSPILDVVSNVSAEAISEEIGKLGHAEFSPIGIGIGRVFDLSVQLDAESLALLRDFGKQESGLALQAKGMKLATSEGFVDFNLMQGQRAALEGLGKGLSTGNGPLMMTGFNLGANLTGSSGRASPRLVSSPARPSTVLATQTMFIVKDGGGESGPHSARQLALLAISKGLALADMQIRSTEDPVDVSFSADLEPQIAAEYKRRLPQSAPPPSAATNPNEQVFLLSFTAAVRNGQLGKLEVDMLSNLALSLGLTLDQAGGRMLVVKAAESKGVRVDA